MDPPRRPWGRRARAVFGAIGVLLSCTSGASAAESVDHVREFVANASVTAFFYLWYGNPALDGRYLHWDHFLLPHWTAAVNDRYKDQVRKYHNPDMGNLHSPFYPMRGPYSSRDPEVIRGQLTELRDNGVDVVALSWWGRPDRKESADSQGVSTDDVVPVVLKEADALGGIRVAMHLEPYPGRSVESVREDLSYLVERYSSSPSFLPLYYVYDSYHIAPQDWARLLTPDGDVSVRGTGLDGVMVGLWLEGQHGEELASGGFDGFYTYFASQGFSYGSTTARWASMVDFATQTGMLSILSVGPGYDDTKIRPWNEMSTKDREGGAYLDRMFAAALRAGPSAVSLTSYNEWGEGTQLEPAVPFRCETSWEGNETHLAITPYQYESYPEGDALFYLKKVQSWSGRFKHRDAVGGEGSWAEAVEEEEVEGGLQPHDPEVMGREEGEEEEEEGGWEQEAEEVMGEDEPVGDLSGLMMEEDGLAGVEDL